MDKLNFNLEKTNVASNDSFSLRQKQYNHGKLCNLIEENENLYTKMSKFGENVDAQERIN